MPARRKKSRPRSAASLTRRGLLLAAAAAAPLARAQSPATPPKVWRNEEKADVTVRRLLGDAKPQTGRIQLVLPEIAESGNSVALSVRVDSPMTAADHVRLVHLVAERNPRPWVASFTLGPRAGKAMIDTYIRLSDTTAVTAYAQMSDGSWWMQRTNVVVTIGACESLGTRH